MTFLPVVLQAVFSVRACIARITHIVVVVMMR